MTLSPSINTRMDLEALIKFLKIKGITAIEIAKKLGIERGEFYSWRTSVKAERREELRKEIMEHYAEEIEAEAKTDKEGEIAEKYTTTLEQFVEQLQRENVTLRKQNEQFWEKFFGGKPSE